MGKSRYSKTKGAGALVGITRYKKSFKFKEAGQNGDVLAVENRTMRRLKGKA